MTNLEDNDREPFDNENCSLSKLDEDELNYVAAHVCNGDSWDEILEDITEVPTWLEARSKHWEHLPLISFDTGESIYGYLYIIWDNARDEGVMCDRGCDEVYRVSGLRDLDPALISSQALDYIENTWGLSWLLNAETVDVDGTDLLLKAEVLKCLSTKVPAKDWTDAMNGSSPEEWGARYYLKS